MGEFNHQKANKNNPRVEKIAIKDAKLRTFIAADKGREDLVAHVYDITYGAVESNKDNSLRNLDVNHMHWANREFYEYKKIKPIGEPVGRVLPK